MDVYFSFTKTGWQYNSPFLSNGSYLLLLCKTKFLFMKTLYWDEDPLSFVTLDSPLQCSTSHSKMSIQLLLQKSAGIKNAQRFSSCTQLSVCKVSEQRKRIWPSQNQSKLQKINWEKSKHDHFFSFCHTVPVLTISLTAMTSVLFCSNSSLHFSNIFSSLFSDKLIIADWSYIIVFMCKAKWFKGGWKISLHSI